MNPRRLGKSWLVILCFLTSMYDLAWANPHVSSNNQLSRIPRLAAIVTVYRRNSHADMIIGRILQGNHLDGTGGYPRLKLASLYVDQVGKNDMSVKLSKKYKFPIYQSIADTLTLKTGKLAVDGVLLIAEHGSYPESTTGSVKYPKRRFFSQLFQVMELSGRSVPVFSDKHLADNWADAWWIYQQANRLKVPLMAGSSLPVMWRLPQKDLQRGEKVQEITGVSYCRLDACGFHGLEMIQSIAERRAGGETGIQSVQTFSGRAVWQAAKQGVYDRKLLDKVLSGLIRNKISEGQTVEQLVKDPVLFSIQYDDGLKANLFTLNGAVTEWNVAWKDKTGRMEQVAYVHQTHRPYAHFIYLLKGVEKMIYSRKPTWPVERTLLTSGVLDALLISRFRSGKRIETPYLGIKYQTKWNWSQPQPMPANRE